MLVVVGTGLILVGSLALVLVFIASIYLKIFTPFKQNPYEYTQDKYGNDVVIDNTEKNE